MPIVRSQHFKAKPPRPRSKRPSESKNALLPSLHPTRTDSSAPVKAEISIKQAIDDASSDSSLTDPPSDLESPFPDDDPLISAGLCFTSKKTRKKKTSQTRSPYFPKKPREPISCLPFPSTSAESFGLMQEKLAHDPFRLIIATIFLNRTRGEQAMPVYYQLMEQYPTVECLSNASLADVVAIIHKLGFQNQRAKKCIQLAKYWLVRPPTKGKRYRRLDYPNKGDGRNIRSDETISDEDSRVGWEIAGLPGVGDYALDSWRMFCRDELRGLANSQERQEDSNFEPEWTRVVPKDKELRAYLTWMWLKRGMVWNKETGERTKADSQTLERGLRGGIVREIGNDWILESPIKNMTNPNLDIVKPAGIFIPGKK